MYDDVPVSFVVLRLPLLAVYLGFVGRLSSDIDRCCRDCDPGCGELWARSVVASLQKLAERFRVQTHAAGPVDQLRRDHLLVEQAL